MASKDFYSDAGATLFRVFGAGQDLPEYVLDGDYSVDPGEMSTKRAGAFADTSDRTLPIHDPANTWVSYLYARVHESDDDVMGRIQKAASFFGIGDDLDLIESKIRSFDRQNKRASSVWSLDVPCTNGVFSISGEGVGSISRACDEVTSKPFEYDHPMADRRKIARQIIASCPKELQNEIPDRVMKTAGLGVPDMEDLVASVVARSLVIKEDDRDLFIKAAGQLTNLDSGDRTMGMLEQTCDFLDSFDKVNNLTRFYGNRFPDPVSSVFRHTIKEAETLSRSVKVAGVVLRPEFASDGLLEDLSTVTGTDITRENITTKFASLDPAVAEAVAGIIQLHESQG